MYKFATFYEAFPTRTFFVRHLLVHWHIINVYSTAWNRIYVFGTLFDMNKLVFTLRSRKEVIATENTGEFQKSSNFVGICWDFLGS